MALISARAAATESARIRAWAKGERTTNPGIS